MARRSARASGDQTTLNRLFNLIQDALRQRDPKLSRQTPTYRDFRPGDIRHSVADIRKARELLGYEPGVSVSEGLEQALDWYRSQ